MENQLGAKLGCERIKLGYSLCQHGIFDLRKKAQSINIALQVGFQALQTYINISNLFWG